MPRDDVDSLPDVRYPTLAIVCGAGLTARALQRLIAAHSADVRLGRQLGRAGLSAHDDA
jgi:hypothetical protein